MIKPGESPYRTSTYTNNNGACVQVGSEFSDEVGIRDSKIDDSHTVVVEPTAWSAFLDFARQH